MTHNLKVQYGCGLSAQDGWLNFDASPTLKLQRMPLIGPLITSGRVKFRSSVKFGDVTQRLPLKDGSSEQVYCSHVLEHLSYEDFRAALRETHRILAPGGVFRGVLPDLEQIARDYLKDDTDKAAQNFMEESLLGLKSRQRGMKGLVTGALGNQQHLWMWDYKGLERELGEAGFVDIRRAYFHDSGIDAFDAIEDKSRWDNCLGFQCTRL